MTVVGTACLLSAIGLAMRAAWELLAGSHSRYQNRLINGHSVPEFYLRRFRGFRAAQAPVTGTNWAHSKISTFS
jgi:hypothetical protein